MMTAEHLLPVLKVVWAGFVLLAIVVNAFTCLDALTDYRIVLQKRPGDQAYRIRARQSFRDDLVTLLFNFGVFYVRFWSLFWPNPDDPVFARNWAIDGSFLTVLSLMLAWNCWLDRRDRKRAIELL